MFFDRSLACIIRRQRQRFVAFIAIQQITEELYSPLDIFGGIENVLYAEPFGGLRQQLHQPPRTLLGNGERVVAAFLPDDRVNQLRRNSMPPSSLLHQGLNAHPGVRILPPTPGLALDNQFP